MTSTPTNRALRLLALISLLFAGTALPSDAQSSAGRGQVLCPNGQRQAPELSSILGRGSGGAGLSFAQYKPGPLQVWPGWFPILVLPAKKGFSDLQAALDFCATTPAIPATVLLSPGTYTGNFTLPAAGSTTIVGREGPFATWIEGQAGVIQPTLSFAPASGPTLTQAMLQGVQLRGEELAVVDYAGSGSNALLLLEGCFVDTQSSIPAIRMAGAGFDVDNRLELELRSSLLESQGDGITANVGSYVRVSCQRSGLSASDTAVDMQAAGGSQGTELILYDGAGVGQSALRAGNLEHLWCGAFFLSGSQVVADLDGIVDARFERSEFHSETSDVIRISNTWLRVEYMQVSADAGNPAVYGLRVHNSSKAEVAFCGFNTAGTNASNNNAFDVDGSSSATSTFNHWQFVPLP